MHHPKVAEEFAAHTPKSAYKNLPEHVDEKKGKREYMKSLSKKYIRRKSEK